MWEDRWKYIIKAKRSSSGPHFDEYMVWYSLNTIMRVSRIREAEGHRPTDQEHAVEHELNEPSIPQRRVNCHVYPLVLFR